MVIEITSPGDEQDDPNEELFGTCENCGARLKCLREDIDWSDDEFELIECPHCGSADVEMNPQWIIDHNNTPMSIMDGTVLYTCWILFFIITPLMFCLFHPIFGVGTIILGFAIGIGYMYYESLEKEESDENK